jgi:hypothetical protein
MNARGHRDLDEILLRRDLASPQRIVLLREARRARADVDDPAVVASVLGPFCSVKNAPLMLTLNRRWKSASVNSNAHWSRGARRLFGGAVGYGAAREDGKVNVGYV